MAAYARGSVMVCAFSVSDEKLAEARVLADYHAEHMPDGLPLLLIRDHMTAAAAAVDQVPVIPVQPLGMS